MPVDHERAANAWAELESSTEPPLPHPKERRRKKRVLASLPDDEEPPSPVAAAGLRGSIQEPASAAAPSSSSPIIAPSKRLAIRGPSGSPSRCARLACCGCGALTCAAGGRSRARRVVRIGVPLVLLALIFWLLSYSGFQHDFLRVSSNSQYKTDFPLSLCAIALASVLLRMPTVVRQLQCAPSPAPLRRLAHPTLTPRAAPQAPSLLCVGRGREARRALAAASALPAARLRRRNPQPHSRWNDRTDVGPLRRPPRRQRRRSVRRVGRFRRQMGDLPRVWAPGRAPRRWQSAARCVRIPTCFVVLCCRWDCVRLSA